MNRTPLVTIAMVHEHEQVTWIAGGSADVAVAEWVCNLLREYMGAHQARVLTIEPDLHEVVIPRDSATPEQVREWRTAATAFRIARNRPMA